MQVLCPRLAPETGEDAQVGPPRQSGVHAFPQGDRARVRGGAQVLGSPLFSILDSLRFLESAHQSDSNQNESQLQLQYHCITF